MSEKYSPNYEDDNFRAGTNEKPIKREDEASESLDIYGTRHSLQTNRRIGENSVEGYSELSEKGVELAKKRASEILETLVQSEEGSVLAFIGASEAERTKSTIKVYGDEISRIIDDNKVPNVEVIDSRSFDEQAGVTEDIERIAKEINSQAKKKFLIACPLYIKELGLQNRWQNKDGSWSSEYAEKLFTENNFDNQEILREWLADQGEIGDLKGPNPKELAEEELEGLKRINGFIAKFIQNRPVTIGFVGHTPNIEALAIYLANEGIVDLEGFEKIGGKSFAEADVMQLKEDKIILPKAE
jgi:hypothetical protein